MATTPKKAPSRARKAPAKRPSTKKAPAKKAPAKRAAPKAQREAPQPDQVELPELVADAASTGDRARTLRALRDRLAKSIDSPAISGTELASLSRQLTQVTAELDRIGAPKEASKVDELAKFRAARLAGAETPARAAERQQRRRGGDRAR